jgi:hypothetical protein
MTERRCRASDEAKRRGLRRGVAQEGVFLGMTRNGRWAKVVWDGTVTEQCSHPDFIEIINADGETSRASEEKKP